MRRSRTSNGHYLTKYFTQIPNVIDDAELDTYEFRLLIHYYRVGECWESVRTTASKCKMSIGKVSEVRKSLHQKGFIILSESEDGVTITVVDKSRENVEKYRSCNEQSVHTEQTDRSPHEKERSYSEPKNNQLRITNKEEGSVAVLIIDKINEIKKQFGYAGRIQLTDERAKHILARMKENKATLADVMRMLEHKGAKWMVKPEMAEHFNPDTLFRKSNFVRYMEESAAQPESGWLDKAAKPEEVAEQADDERYVLKAKPVKQEDIIYPDWRKRL